MKTLFKRFNVKLTAIGPVFIGSGEILKRAEYVIVDNGKKIFFPDMGKLYKEIPEENKLDFEKLLCGESVDGKKNMRLGDYLVNQLKWTDIPKSVCDPLRIVIIPTDETKCFKTAMNWKIVKENSENSYNEIHDFIYNSDKKPYIPGSSLKGAIRTVIAGDLNKNLDKMKKKDILSVLMRAIKISDSLLIERKYLKIYRKFDEVAQKGKYSLEKDKISHEIPLARVCLAPKTPINFGMTIDLSILEQFFGENADKMVKQDWPLQNVEEEKFTSDFINYISKRLQKRYHTYKQDYLHNFDHTNKDKADKAQGKVAYLGGGAGIYSKTAYLDEYDKKVEREKNVQKVLDKQFSSDKNAKERRDHMNKKSLNKFNSEGESKCKCGKCNSKFSNQIYIGDDSTAFGVSPRAIKLTKYNNQYYEIGLCQFEIEEVG
ncbi:MAG: type III-A CRISPR-associated RAMP protein Csm5 [Candidatus Ancillula sp.]|nr:type III-A CRISPR-associated RAMP protein Csm5 [Candidatus Ancillula sp.]